mgnify:CR=1 FL=1
MWTVTWTHQVCRREICIWTMTWTHQVCIRETCVGTVTWTHQVCARETCLRTMTWTHQVYTTDSSSLHNGIVHMNCDLDPPSLVSGNLTQQFLDLFNIKSTCLWTWGQKSQETLWFCVYIYISIYLSIHRSIYLSIFKMYGQILQAVGKTHHNKKQHLETPGQLWAKDFSDIKKIGQ